MAIHTVIEPNEFQSTLPMRGVTNQLFCFWYHQRISIHTPHAGSDIALLFLRLHLCIFQSTLPMRGVTLQSDRLRHTLLFQSTLPMRGVTEYNDRQCMEAALFQSTLPMRGVTCYRFRGIQLIQFQSTLPMRGVTLVPDKTHAGTFYFNPHSPCGE